jgi:mono/diheme cytochrome c family protein
MIYSKIRRLIPVLFSFLLVLFISSGAKAQPNGEALFKSNCTSCHAIGSQLIGPDLKGIEKRRPNDWIIKWVHSPDAMIKGGDAYAVSIFEKFNKTPMTAFPQLKDAEIVAIVDYIKAYKVPEVKKGPTDNGPGGASESPTNWTLILSIAAIILFTLAYVLKRAVSGLDKVVRQKEGLAPKQVLGNRAATWYWLKNNKKMLAVILIVLTSWGSYAGWYALKGIGVVQGYTPDQPIAFSHKIHAGENAISCIYCHSGAEKGKTAGVPSANVCMNCHKAIKSGTNTGTEEIAKIYKALDYDPNTGVYGKNQKPIVWTRVHNLPDLAYFNHSQHVVVGKLDCAVCHGDVKEMTVASQFAPLTMGWCINCHRTTPVQMKGNHYYDSLHVQLSKSLHKDTLTVDKIGGMECSRCHY